MEEFDKEKALKKLFKKAMDDCAGDILIIDPKINSDEDKEFLEETIKASENKNPTI